MIEMTAPEKAQAAIVCSFAEYTALFKKPILETWGTSHLASFINALLCALDPFGFRLDLRGYQDSH